MGALLRFYLTKFISNMLNEEKHWTLNNIFVYGPKRHNLSYGNFFSLEVASNSKSLSSPISL